MDEWGAKALKLAIAESEARQKEEHTRLQVAKGLETNTRSVRELQTSVRELQSTADRNEQSLKKLLVDNRKLQADNRKLQSSLDHLVAHLTTSSASSSAPPPPGEGAAPTTPGARPRARKRTAAQRSSDAHGKHVSALKRAREARASLSARRLSSWN